ncbi:MAG: hypothetical protein QNJ51_27470 [Calothrix sp. MO_167.B12]|nr:hypothetical protein [Calothrix sp. MO_167.B12]
MSVVSGRKIIFCEGKQKSLDSQLLNKLVENLSVEKPTIVASGSKFTFSVFTEGYFYPDEISNQQYIVFRDRDFDVYPTQNIQLLELNNQKGKTLAFLTHRACVENYLIDADLIHRYWDLKYSEKLENPSSKWGHGNSPGIETIAQWIENSAKELQDYQAVRWALADLLQRRVQLKTTWTVGSGNLPSSLALQDCRVQALDLINQFRGVVDTVTQEKFETSLTNYRNQFTQPKFWNNKQYLIWFHGKDLQKMMNKQNSKYISLKHFFNWAITELDITRYSDLLELRSKIKQL